MKGEGKRTNKKCLAIIVAVLVVQAVVILVLALTIGKIKSPKVRFGSVEIENMSSSNPNSPSFNMRLRTQYTIKNTNFGHFKYDNSSVTILYGDVPIGEAFISKGRARARQTRRLNIVVDISSDTILGNTNLANDMNSGFLPLTSQSRLDGKVHLLKAIKKKKSAQMSCTMVVNLGTRAVDLKCK